jgi:hypothetical protein
MDRDQLLQLRAGAQLKLVLNANYFGSWDKVKDPGFQIAPAIQPLFENTSFERLECLGYDPGTRELAASVEVLQGSGYGGGPCSAGSHEYVRFFIDWGAGWTDIGVSGFNIHDLGFDAPLCYAVRIAVSPEVRRFCDQAPVLPRVRAILSWNTVPPAGQPDWTPPWGNRIDRTIQIAPRLKIVGPLHDFLATDLQIKPDIIAKITDLIPLPQLPDPPIPDPAPLAYLLETGQRLGVPVTRTLLPMVRALSLTGTSLTGGAIGPILAKNLPAFADFLDHPKFNTTYEELHCLSLDRDASVLHGVIQVKLAGGYSGGLCTAGSREYVAFYLDFGSGWQYMGTTSVVVHDVPGLPADGLWYQVALPVDLTPHQQEWCRTGRARLRGILSWATPPTPGMPDEIPHWGDREDCTVEIKPLPEGIVPGTLAPFVEAIGSMPVNRIDPVTGLATGANIFSTFSASLSPFGGVTTIAGLVASAGGTPLEYRVMVRAPGMASAQPLTSAFDLTVTTVSGGSTTTAQVHRVPDAQGWVGYLQSATSFVAGNLYAPYVPGVNGMHEVHVEIRHALSHVPLGATAPRRFFADIGAPDVAISITSGLGNCGKFGVGEVIAGTYSMSDAHAGVLTLGVAPGGPAHGATPVILTAAPAAAGFFPPVAGSLSFAALTLPNGGTAGTWELDTGGMDPCGYVVTIHGIDRTVVNSGGIGWHGITSQGFCLEVKP